MHSDRASGTLRFSRARWNIWWTRNGNRSNRRSIEHLINYATQGCTYACNLFAWINLLEYARAWAAIGQRKNKPTKKREKCALRVSAAYLMWDPTAESSLNSRCPPAIFVSSCRLFLPLNASRTLLIQRVLSSRRKLNVLPQKNFLSCTALWIITR